MDTVPPDTAREITVLIVNDSERFMRALNEFLAEQRRLKVIGTAKGGNEAVQLIHQQGPPQVILLDLNMPERSGMEIIPLLREIVPEACIILLTSETAPQIKRAVLAAGANDYVPKDQLLEELIPTILRCVAV